MVLADFVSRIVGNAARGLANIMTQKKTARCPIITAEGSSTASVRLPNITIKQVRKCCIIDPGSTSERLGA